MVTDCTIIYKTERIDLENINAIRGEWKLEEETGNNLAKNKKFNFEYCLKTGKAINLSK